MRKQARLIRPPSPLGARPFFDLFEGQISKLNAQAGSTGRHHPLGGSTDKDAQAGSTDKAAITFRCSTIF